MGQSQARAAALGGLLRGGTKASTLPLEHGGGPFSEPEALRRFAGPLSHTTRSAIPPQSIRWLLGETLPMEAGLLDWGGGHTVRERTTTTQSVAVTVTRMITLMA